MVGSQRPPHFPSLSEGGFRFVHPQSVFDAVIYPISTKWVYVTIIQWNIWINFTSRVLNSWFNEPYYESGKIFDSFSLLVQLHFYHKHQRSKNDSNEEYHEGREQLHEDEGRVFCLTHTNILQSVHLESFHYGSTSYIICFYDLPYPSGCLSNV